jgi:hypothetical protein
MAGTATAPASTEPTSPAVLSPQEMNDGQLQEFFAKGTRFEKPEDGADDLPADQPADSAPADAVDTAASTDALPQTASETVKPEKKTKGKAVTERNVDLRAEIDENARLLNLRRQQREELARQPEPTSKKADQPAAPAPATTEPTEADFKRYLAMPGAPKAEQFDGDLDAYTAAMGTFIAKQISREQFDQMFSEREQKTRAESEQLHELNEAITTAEARAQADEARDPQWRDKLDPAFARIPPARLLQPGQKPNVMNFIKDQVMFESEHPCSLSVYLCSDEGKTWAKTLVGLRPERIVREIAIKDASFGTSPDDDTTPSHVSAAPPPGPTLGRKPSAPVDPLKAAMDSGDAEAFITQRNRSLVGKR